METAAEAIDEARRALEALDDKEAAHILGQAVYMTSDAELLDEIHQLALLGRRSSKANRIVRAMRWDGVVRSAETRLGEARERSSASAAI